MPGWPAAWWVQETDGRAVGNPRVQLGAPGALRHDMCPWPGRGTARRGSDFSPCFPLVSAPHGPPGVPVEGLCPPGRARLGVQGGGDTLLFFQAFAWKQEGGLARFTCRGHLLST